MKKVILLIIISTMISAGLYAEEEKPAPKGMGLTVEPGGILVQNVPVGITYDFTKEVRIPLTIYNRDDRPHTYILTTNKPSEVAARKWLKGYLEIPNPSWFWFDKDQVTIEPNTTAKVNMYLKTPKADKYHNQHWAVSLGVSGKPEKDQMFALAVYPRVEIETLAKGNVRERPHGPIGFVPSTILFESLSLSTEKIIGVKIYNNDTKKHRFKITPMIFPKNPRRRQISLSPAYSWIPKTKWIKPGRKDISIPSNKYRDIPIRVKIPKKLENYNKNWEAIIFVEPDKGLPGFVRVQIKTEKVKK